MTIAVDWDVKQQNKTDKKYCFSQNGKGLSSIKPEIVLKRCISGPTFSPKIPNMYPTRFGPYEIKYIKQWEFELLLYVLVIDFSVISKCPLG